MRDKYSVQRVARLGFSVLLLTLIVSTVALSGAPTTIHAQGGTLLDEQFQDNSNGWQLATTKNSTLDVADGSLTIALSKVGAASWATPDMTFPDNIDVQVDMTTTVVPDSGDWSSAIIIRADTRDVHAAFYQFEVSNQGEWAFVTRTPDGAEYKIQKSGQIDGWDMTANNTLKVQARGTNFTFLVNGKRVGVFEDDQINNDPSADKYIGLLVTTFEKTPSVTVAFSNLTVKATSGGSGAGATKTPIKIKTPVKTPVEATPVSANSGDTLLEENFPDDNPNEWLTGGDNTATASITNNSLQIEIKKELWLLRSSPSTQFPQDIDVSVTATNPKPDPKGQWSYDIGVRGYTVNDQDYFYLYSVYGDGTWQFEKREGEKGYSYIVKTTKIKGSFRLRRELCYTSLITLLATPLTEME